MNSKELRKKFLDFFKEKGHTIIPSASLIPENDPTVLFTTAGMHPLVPFLLGEKHPGGKRLANFQACIRTSDIDEVGDDTHHTFFEMLGNWSLGDSASPDGVGKAGYFKKEAIEMSFEFLTSKKRLGLDKEKLAISIFKGDPSTSSGLVMQKDEESKKIWLKLGIPEERIRGLPKKDNWWGPAGKTGPCGPDTEMFYWTGKESAPKDFDPEDKRWVEIWNDVFMEYFKNKNGKYEPLSQKNVDTGMGLERVLSVINGLGDDYKTDVFLPIVKKIEELSGREYKDNKKEFRIISDHIKAATLIIGDKRGVGPSNLKQGYVVRRLLRRAIRYGKILDLKENFLAPLIQETVKIYKDVYPEIKRKENDIITIVQKEEENFEKTLEKGLKEAILRFKRIPQLTGDVAFDLYETYGMPLEVTEEFARERNIDVSGNIKKEFEERFQEHQKLSRSTSSGMFKGGLADSGAQAVKYHTATHLLLAALRQVLGGHVIQKGSNITAERLRLDFSHPEKMTKDQIKRVEDIVNQKIKEDLKVSCEEMSLKEARKKGAMGVFEDRYGDKVKVYSVDKFSKEVCGGPHVERTGKLGHFKIKKEESSSAGVRRIKAVLE
jgi:alanyl-tRNA synthetase